MKKYLSIAILLMMMASPVVFTSCGNDDPMEEVESPETKLDVWTEPYHIMGVNVDEVKSYMAQSMKRYRQVAETSGDNIQLTFMTGQGSEGVLYSFSRLDGSLYSVIDTERSVNRGLVIDYLKKHYTLVSADEASLQYCFTNPEKSMVITTMKVSDSYFNVNYSLVYLLRKIRFPPSELRALVVVVLDVLMCLKEHPALCCAKLFMSTLRL